MSNHFSAAMLKFPGDDARLDLTDLFLFASPESAGKTVLIFNVNPFMTGADFNPEAVYRLNIDNDGDTQADVAFSFVFSESRDGAQTGTVYYATGSQAREPEAVGEVLIEGMPVGFDAMAKPVEAGECRLFVGVRSDPFFADGEGAFHGFKFTGDDTFAGKNILSMAMEVPNEMLGAGPEIAVWAPRACIATERWCRSTGTGTRRSTRSSSTSSRTSSTPDTRPMTWRASSSPGRSCWRAAATRRRSPRDGPHRAPRRHALQPHAAGALPERPGPHGRRLRHPYGVPDVRTGHLRRRRAARRLPEGVPVPRLAERPGAERREGGRSSVRRTLSRDRLRRGGRDGSDGGCARAETGSRGSGRR